MAFSFRPSTAYTCTVMIPVTIFFAVFLLILSPIEFFFRFGIYGGRRLGPVAVFVRNSWMRWVFVSHGIRLQRHGTMIAPEGQGIVVVSNHKSLLDIPAIFLMAPRNTVFLAKKELLYIPFFGWAAWIAGTQFIDRKKGARDPHLNSVSKLLSKGFSLVVFPEGTRSHNGELLPFKRGAAVMAIDAGVNILPLAIEGSDRCLPKKSLAIGPGNIEIAVGDVVKTEGLSLDRRIELTENLRDRVKELQHQLRSLKS